MAIDTGIEIVHELPERLRIRCPAFRDRNFDPAYQEAMLENIAGVFHVRINPVAASVVIEHDGRLGTRGAILANLGALPEEAFENTSTRPAPPNPIVLASIGIATVLSVFVPRPLKIALSIAIAIPTITKGIVTLFVRGLKVEVLDGAAVGFSLLRRDYVTANIIVFLLTIGEYLERISREKSTDLLRHLLRPRVTEVWIDRDNKEIAIPSTEVKINDMVVCGPGELVPVDGEVAYGEALLNQASITGESLPVHVEPGQKALSGAVVEEGTIKIRAERVGNDTSMARINRFLETSLRSKSPSQTKSEELADRLVPVTFGIGSGIFLLTRDATRAASVLTIDYSCAIKLANPVAVTAAMYSAGREGILLRGAGALDGLAEIDTLVLDKTGTLTKGVLKVTDVISLGSMKPDDLLSLAAGAEEHYTHPVAGAVVAAARERNLELPPVSEVDFIVAHGVSAYVDGERVVAGSRHFIEDDEKIDCSAADEMGHDLYSQGKSMLFVVRSRRLEGVIAMSDELRPEASYCLEKLKETGIKKIIILTGDHRRTAMALAGQLKAVDEIHWELDPADKAAIVERLHAQGARIAFAGDGVNDAPALVTADVGISLPEGSDLAKESAQVVLLKSDLRLLLAARITALRTRRTLKTGFAATIGLNTLFLLLAVFGRIQPVTAALLHNLNTVAVVTYSAGSGLAAPPALPENSRKSQTGIIGP